jgi:hypothetical protein
MGLDEDAKATRWFALGRKQKNMKKYITSLNQTVTEVKQLCYNNDKRNCGNPYV